jgi:3-deoxy-D-manno-octulosonic-acid transferase
MSDLDTGSNIQQQTAATWREKTQLIYLRRQGEQPRKYLVLFVPRHPKYIKSVAEIHQMLLVLTGISHRI